VELVYLWVENYKNIYHQGFNFSPRFHCKYNDKTKELTINENDDYIPDFFGKNINITAIVGKNGSGKSSLLSSLSNIKEVKGKGFLLYQKSDNTFFAISSNKYKKILYENNLPLSDYLFEIKFLSYIFSYSGYLTQNEEEKDFYNKFFYFLNKDSNFFSFISKNFVFDSYRYEIKYIFSDEILTVSWDIKWNTKFVKFLFANFDDNDIAYEDRDLFYLLIGLCIVDEVFSNIDEEKIPVEIKNIFKDKYDRTRTDYFYLDDKFIEKIIRLSNNFSYNKEISEIFSKESIDFILSNFSFGDIYSDYSLSIKSQIYSVKDDSFRLNNKLLSLLYNKGLLRCNFFKKKNPSYSFYSLSSGERLYLNIIIDLAYQLDKVEKKDCLILLDEPDLGLHPNWQKQLLKDLILIVNKISRKNIHLTFTTHSPFMLSDLPIQNIIFLEDGEQIDGLNDKKQTFGANIHTLLSNSFFMEDGLMGEFAKSKINEIKKLYQLIQNKHIQKKLKEVRTKELAQKAFYRRRKRLWQIQKIIGEPFLQKVIKNYLDELEMFFSDDKTLIDKELQEIEERRKYLEALKKGKK